MARLNESTAAAESVDALRRRFVRQNREIARVNSIQSIRIRGLESEVSRLLSENVTLREQVISLSQEIERFEAAKTFSEGVYEIKGKLDVKLAEINGLLVDLGKLPRKFNGECNKGTATTNSKLSRQLSSGLHRRVYGSEYDRIAEDGQLPAILEDKCYPRRTLESAEIQDLSNSDLDTPGFSHTGQSQVGRPGSHEDDLNIGILGISSHRNVLGTDTQHDDAFLPPTLETRKKKRSSPDASAESDYTIPSAAHNSNNDDRYILKPGSKRKFGSGEDDGKKDEFDSINGDGRFRYNRTIPPSHNSTTSFMTVPHSPLDQSQSEAKKGRKDHGPPKRRVLQPKSTNASIPSPKKHQGGVQYQEHHKETDVENQHQPMGKTCGINEREDSSEKPGCYHIDQCRPEKNDGNVTTTQKLPAGKTLDSPYLEESVAQERLDSAGTLDPQNSHSRPTRRQRAVVSYAEPNLRDKMRRSTNEFIDAVAGGNSRASGSRAIQENEKAEGKKCSKTKTSIDTAAESGDILGSGSNTIGVKDASSMPREILDYHVEILRRKRGYSSEDKHDSSFQDYTVDMKGGIAPSGYIQQTGERHGDGDASDLEEQSAEGRTISQISTKTSKTVSATRKRSRRHSSKPKSAGPGSLPRESLQLRIEPQPIPPGKDYLGSILAIPSKSEEHIPEAASLPTEDSQAKHNQRCAMRRRSMIL